MNVQSYIDKILIALKQKGQIYYINQNQYYSSKLHKVCTKFIVFQDHPKNDGVEFFSKRNLLLYLVDAYKKSGDTS